MSSQCDALNAFYDYQDREIKAINSNYDSLLEDYTWTLKSDAYMAA